MNELLVEALDAPVCRSKPSQLVVGRDGRHRVAHLVVTFGGAVSVELLPLALFGSQCVLGMQVAAWSAITTL